MNHQHHHDQDTALSDLYRRAPAPEPPAALDSQIFKLAREEQKITRLPRVQRWQWPLALAAVLVLAVSLLPLLRQQLPGMDARAPVDAFSENLPPPASVPVLDEESVPSADTRSQERAEGASAARVVSRQSPNTVESQQSPATATTAAPAEAPAALMAPEVMTESAMPAPAAEPAAPAVDQAPARTAVFTDPERWLTWIRLLQRQGREAEAEAELDAFRRQFPNHPLEGLELPLEP